MPRYAGYVAWRGLLPEADIPDHIAPADSLVRSPGCSGSENRCLFPKACTATPCDGTTVRDVQLLQEVDIGLSSEIVLSVRLVRIPADGKNRCVLVRESVGAIGDSSRRQRGPTGTVSGTILGRARFRQVEASRILSFLAAVRWPSG
jgi:hypothetical protein